MMFYCPYKSPTLNMLYDFPLMALGSVVKYSECPRGSLF